MSLWNGMRLQAGKSPLGFINPFLYRSSAFTQSYYDVTSGNNADSTTPLPLLLPLPLYLRQRLIGPLLVLIQFVMVKPSL